MKVRLYAQAETDFAGILRYIAERNPSASRTLNARIETVLRQLAAGEYAGRQVQMRSGKIVLTWPVKPVRIYYQCRGDTLWVVRIYHQRRRPITR